MPRIQYKIKEIKVLIEIERDGRCFHAYAPALKGLHVEGATAEEAFERAEEAVDVYLDSMYREDAILPVGPYLTVQYEPVKPSVPAALLRDVTVKWPIQRMSGTR